MLSHCSRKSLIILKTNNNNNNNNNNNISGETFLIQTTQWFKNCHYVITLFHKNTYFSKNKYHTVM